MHLLQALVALLESLHDLELDLGKLDVVHHLLQVLQLCVRLLQQRLQVALLLQQQFGLPGGGGWRDGRGQGRGGEGCGRDVWRGGEGRDVGGMWEGRGGEAGHQDAA